jgi:uncharacterized protein YdhG (YjbR/CyaY superfamily)
MPAKSKSASKAKTSSFSAEEKAAMKQRAQELKNSAKGEKAKEQVLETIKAMAKPDRELAMAVHDLITSVSPDLEIRTWYGMPAYYKNGKVLCFFQSAGKWKTRYATLGFDESAKLDDGSMWPTACF